MRAEEGCLAPSTHGSSIPSNSDQAKKKKKNNSARNARQAARGCLWTCTPPWVRRSVTLL